MWIAFLEDYNFKEGVIVIWHYIAIPYAIAQDLVPLCYNHDFSLKTSVTVLFGMLEKYYLGS